MRDLGAEFGGDLFARDDGIFHHVVQDRGRDRRAVHFHIRENASDGQRMLDVILAGSTVLPLVGGIREFVHTAQPSAIHRRVVRLDFGDQIFDVRGWHMDFAYYAIDRRRVSMVAIEAAPRPAPALILKEARNFMAGERGATVEKFQFDQKRVSDDVRTQLRE